MRDTIQKLYDAQSVLKRFPTSAPEYEMTLTRLRQEIPSALLAHFLRLVEQGAKGAAPVHHGVCSSCHMRVPSGVEGALKRADDLVLCENCSAYLFIPSEESQPPAPIKPKARRKKMVAAVVAEAARS